MACGHWETVRQWDRITSRSRQGTLYTLTNIVKALSTHTSALDTDVIIIKKLLWGEYSTYYKKSGLSLVPRPLRFLFVLFSVCNIEKLGVAWKRGGYSGLTLMHLSMYCPTYPPPFWQKVGIWSHLTNKYAGIWSNFAIYRVKMYSPKGVIWL